MIRGEAMEKRKLRQIRYWLLGAWGILLGATGTAGIQSSWHVIPRWLICSVVILGIVVVVVWGISLKKGNKENYEEMEYDNYERKHQLEKELIATAVEEPLNLEFWGKRNGIDHFSVNSICGHKIEKGYKVLISFDNTPVGDIPLSAAVKGREHSEYFGKLEVLYCKKENGVTGKEKLKTERTFKRVYSKTEWENGEGKIKIKEELKNN